jgi:hypothetical protein
MGLVAARPLACEKFLRNLRVAAILKPKIKKQNRKTIKIKEIFRKIKEN